MTTAFAMFALVSRDRDNPSLKCRRTDNFVQTMEFRQGGDSTAAITSVAKDNLILEIYKLTTKENNK